MYAIIAGVIVLLCLWGCLVSAKLGRAKEGLNAIGQERDTLAKERDMLQAVVSSVLRNRKSGQIMLTRNEYTEEPLPLRIKGDEKRVVITEERAEDE